MHTHTRATDSKCDQVSSIVTTFSALDHKSVQAAHTNLTGGVKVVARIIKSIDPCNSECNSFLKLARTS